MGRQMYNIPVVLQVAVQLLRKVNYIEIGVMKRREVFFPGRGKLLYHLLASFGQLLTQPAYGG